MTTAVTGATGYLGTQMLLCLSDAGRPALGVDSEGALVAGLAATPFALVPAEDALALTEAFIQHGVDEVVHFTGSGAVDLSISDPLTEYQDTLVRTLTVMRACINAGIKRFVFSSTASVYGVPDLIPIKEETPLRPISPFGAAMGMAERIAYDAGRAAGIAVATLRYFNVAGADPLLRAGETGPKARHLIRAAAQIAVGTRAEPLKIYGSDYQTPDGTPIRDFLHVSDMAEAHLAALDHLRRGKPSIVVNCGYGEGASVLEVVEAVGRVTGKPLPMVEAPRREGDPPQLIADDAKVRSVLGWTPRFDDLDLIVKSAIEWEAAQAGAAPAAQEAGAARGQTASPQ